MVESRRIDPSLLPLDAVDRRGGAVQTGSGGQDEDRFNAVLRESITGLKFSAHAEERLRRRNIAMTVEDLERLKIAVDRAASKGSQDSLILIDDKAFVVSVKNKTVITALSGPSVKEGVFTKIDSAVVI